MSFLSPIYFFADLNLRKHCKYEIHGSTLDEDIIATDCMIASRLSSFKKVPQTTSEVHIILSQPSSSIPINDTAKAFSDINQNFTNLIIFKAHTSSSKMSSNPGNVIGMEALLVLMSAW